MNLSWFTKILVHHPFVILLAVSIFSGTCIVIPFTLKSMSFPNFQDPQMGFTTRGTIISNRLTTWANLVKSTKPSGEFLSNPKEYIEAQNKNNLFLKKSPKKNGRKKTKSEPVYGSVYLNDTSNGSETIIDVERWRNVKMLTPGPGRKLNGELIDRYFCGNPDERYAHLVVTSRNSEDLFTLSNVLSMCRLEHKFTKINKYNDLCIQNNRNKCCKPWSVPNYVAVLNNRPSCMSITEKDIGATKALLRKCASFFHNGELTPDCLKKDPYCSVPIDCVQHDAVYNIFNYLTSTSFLPPNNTDPDSPLMEAMIFLPQACSTAMLPYYHELTESHLEHNGIQVVAMEFGIKTALFDEYLIRDTWLMGSGALFVFASMWLYTDSVFLTVMTIIVIIFSLAISYFMYFLVFEIKFFPFMNLLATVVAIGIGSDDAFIFCKIWFIKKQEQEESIYKLMTDTFQHAFVTMFVTCLTTSTAFLGSYVSCVTAISCFSIFAGTAVIVNYILMMTWFPACMVIWEQSCLSNSILFKSCAMVCLQRWCCCIKTQWNLSNSWFKCTALRNFWKAKEEWLLNLVIKFKYFWLFLFSVAAIFSSGVIFWYPKLHLPSSTEFQLFAASHPFEQYDFVYKKNFWFRKANKGGQDVSSKMPLRFVWGVLPIDNGDHFDPTNLGTLTLDPDFDIADPAAQVWLHNFCQNIRLQPFYNSMIGPLLQNCFVETFVKSMKRKCIDKIQQKNRYPCCETATFPFSRSIFNECIIDEMAEIYKTPSDYLNSGIAGPKFSKDQYMTIKAIVIEYDSNYSYSMSFDEMHEFYTNVETWMNEELKTAPKSMKNGFFVSELEFYDLQRELSESTQTAVLMSMGLGLIVLFLSTLNILTSLYAIIAITSSIFVTMAVIVLMGWELNILESIAISTAIGLTVDFSLHYSVNYRMCPDRIAINREAAARHALSYMLGPALMAAITTAAAGAFMLPSLILPYIQIGIFLVIVMCVSWLYATFFLGSLLAVAGPNKNCGQFNYSSLGGCLTRAEERGQDNEPAGNAESHEMESFNSTYSNKRERATPKPLRRSLSSGGARFTPSKYMFNDESPSATSAITIIMPDDN